MTFGELTATADAFVDRAAGAVGVLSERDAIDAARPLESLTATVRSLLDHATDLDRAVRRTHQPTRTWAIAARDAGLLLDRALENLRSVGPRTPGTPGAPRAIAARYLAAAARGAGLAQDLLQTHFTTRAGHRIARSREASALADPEVTGQVVALAGAWCRHLGEVCDLLGRQTRLRPGTTLARQRGPDATLRAAGNALAAAGRVIDARVGASNMPPELRGLGTHQYRHEALDAPTSAELPETALGLAVEGAERLHNDHTDTRRLRNDDRGKTPPAHTALDLRFVALAAASTCESAALALQRAATRQGRRPASTVALREAADHLTAAGHAWHNAAGELRNLESSGLGLRKSTLYAADIAVRIGRFARDDPTWTPGGRSDRRLTAWPTNGPDPAVAIGHVRRVAAELAGIASADAGMIGERLAGLRPESVRAVKAAYAGVVVAATRASRAGERVMNDVRLRAAADVAALDRPNQVPVPPQLTDAATATTAATRSRRKSTPRR